ncbi:MAG: hypothetical protein ACREIA_20150 [Opitutaceae bacterium]
MGPFFAPETAGSKIEDLLMLMKPLPLIRILPLFLASLIAVAPAAGDIAAKPGFSKQRAPCEKKYQFETDYIAYASDGSRTAAEKVIMKCAVSIDGSGQQTLKCLEFALVDNDGRTRRIPSLAGWKNSMDLAAAEVLGVPHADFQNLTTEDGTALRPDLNHRVYNTFIDFYTFNNVFGRPAPDGAGRDIADLQKMGQPIEHYTACSKPPANLGNAVKEGSYFKNGRVTLQWLGCGEVARQSCAIVRFDSGESSFQMLMEPVPNTPMQVKGGSHYWGDLFINLDDYWVERATFKEIAMTEIVFGEDPPAAAVVKRLGTISLLP